MSEITTNMNDLLSLIEAGYDVDIRSAAKRMDGKNGRGWYVRFVWESDKNGLCTECDWDGFETADECMADMIDCLLAMEKVS